MRLPLLAAALLASGCTMDREPATTSTELSPALASALVGRKAGAPTSCINLRDIRSTRIVDTSAIIYETSASRWYVNRPPSGCPGLRPERALVSRTPSTSLCSGDIVRIIDPPSPIEYGACGLGQFVPYSR